MLDLDYLKKIECVGYLLVTTHIPTVIPASISMIVRQKLKRKLKREGFLPFLPTLNIKPIFSDEEEESARASIREERYTIPARVSFLYISKSCLLTFETIVLESELEALFKFKGNT